MNITNIRKQLTKHSADELDAITSTKASFGENLMVKPVSILNGDFMYGNTAQNFEEILNNGTISSLNSNIIVQSGVGESALMASWKIAKYSPGYGIKYRWTALFDKASVNSLTGLGNILNNQIAGGYFVGYRNSVFGFHKLNDTWTTIQLDDNRCDFGQIYEITIQWLGFGAVILKKADDNGVFREITRFQHVGLLLEPHIKNANFRLIYHTQEGEARGASYNLMIEGSASSAQKKHAFIDRFVVGITTSETYILSVRGKSQFGGVDNFSKAVLREISAVQTSSAQRIVKIIIRRNSVLTTPSWVSAGNTSILEYDTSAVGFSQTERLYETFISSDKSIILDLNKFQIDVSLVESITISALTIANTADFGITLAFREFI